MKQPSTGGYSFATAVTIGLVVGALVFFIFTLAARAGGNYVEAFVGFLGIVVAVAGWYQSTRLTARTQREFLHLQLLNEARHKIVAACRAEQERLSSISMSLHGLLYAQEITPQLRQSTAAKIDAALRRSDSLEWIFVLEEHAALLPELKSARLKLVSRFRKGQDESRAMIDTLLLPGALAPYVTGVIKELSDNLSEQGSLFHDITIHVQDRAFSSVSGHPVEKRDPPSTAVPRIEMVNGELVVVVPDRAHRVRLETAGWL